MHGSFTDNYRVIRASNLLADWIHWDDVRQALIQMSDHLAEVGALEAAEILGAAPKTIQHLLEIHPTPLSPDAPAKRSAYHRHQGAGLASGGDRMALS